MRSSFAGVGGTRVLSRVTVGLRDSRLELVDVAAEAGCGRVGTGGFVTCTSWRRVGTAPPGGAGSMYDMGK